jgi:prephenate dehydrogenase
MNTKRITIIGLGLIGGSLGLALKKAGGTEIEIVGCARRLKVAKKAIECGAVDRAEAQLGEAVSGADIVIVATPVMAIKDIFQQIAGHLPPNVIVSDVGSTKSQVMQWAEDYLPSTVSFVGGHPMTGKETAGLDEAEADLFADCIYCLTPSQSASEEASKAMEEVLGWIGASPLFIQAEQHDELVAGISHLPLILSSTLVSTLARNEQWAQMSKLAASGYRDVTRLASGSPELHRGICATNRKAIAEWIDRYIEHLKEYRHLILNDDQKLEEALREAREARGNWLKNEGRRFNK